MSSSKNHTSLIITVIGDVMLDRYWQGHAGRISPEAPVPVVKMGLEENRPGGAANVANNLATLGARVTLLGLTGADEAGRTLGREIARKGIDTRLIALEGHPTIQKLRVMAGSHQVARVDFEESFSGHEQLLAWPQNTEVLVLSDYNKGTLADCSELIQQAQARSIPVVVDPKGTDWARYRGATLLTPNYNEWVAVGGSPANEEALESAVQAKLEELSLQAILLTRSERGMSLYIRSERSVHIATEAKAVADVTGAGDTVVAAFAAALAEGKSFEQAARFANTAAGVVVGKVGTSVVTRREIQDAQGAGRNPHLPVSRLAEQALEYQSRGERVVFTNGCFDILHAGHVAYLNEAATLGDRLIVGVNSDASVRKLKGPTRPVNQQEQRAAVLAGLQAVDHVVIFDEDTPEALLHQLKPDVLVKGGDYASTEEVVGHEIVQGYGGAVKVLGVVDGISTTKIIERAQVK